jgi:hypothetical protein
MKDRMEAFLFILPLFIVPGRDRVPNASNNTKEREKERKKYTGKKKQRKDKRKKT